MKTTQNLGNWVLFNFDSKDNCADHNDRDNYDDNVSDDNNDDNCDDNDDDDDVDGDDDDEWAGREAVKRSSCLFPHCLRFYPMFERICI